MSLANIFSDFLFILAAYNLSKLPWYVGIFPIPSYGLEASMPFHFLVGYRGSKLWSHPVLFLAPHAIMGSALLIMFGLYLRGNEHLVSSFYALAVIFALHVIPERAGIPNRSKGMPLNQACFVTILTVAGLVVAGAIPQNIGMNIIIVPCLGAPILELLPVISCAVKKIKSKGEYVCKSADGDTPLLRNMHGYSSCPFAKAVDISTNEYPSSKKKE